MRPSLVAPDQFLQLVRQAEPRLLRMAQRMAGQREIAQDLVQEAVLKGWEMVKAGRLEIGPGTVSWLRQATAHAFLNWRRRESKRKTDELAEHHEPADHDPMQQPQQRLEHLDRMEAQLTRPEHAQDIYFHREVMFYSREGRKMEVVTISSRDGITEEQEDQVSYFCA